MTDRGDTDPEPDTCRPVEIDGETIRVRGARAMTEQELGYLAEIIAAAKRKYAAEHGDGPTVAEAAADDARWWGGEKTGE